RRPTSSARRPISATGPRPAPATTRVTARPPRHPAAMDRRPAQRPVTALQAATTTTAAPRAGRMRVATAVPKALPTTAATAGPSRGPRARTRAAPPIRAAIRTRVAMAVSPPVARITRSRITAGTPTPEPEPLVRAPDMPILATASPPDGTTTTARPRVRVATA